MLGHRGQQIGEYAVLVGLAASALLATQIFLTRAVGGTLKAASAEVLGTGTPDDKSTSDDTIRTDVAERGTGGNIHTDAVSSGDGGSHSGFILAEAHGPYLGESVVLKRPTSAMQLDSLLGSLCGNDCQVTDLGVRETKGGALELVAGVDLDGDGKTDVSLMGELSRVMKKEDLMDEIAGPLLMSEQAAADLASLKADPKRWDQLTPGEKEKVIKGLAAAKRINGLYFIYGQVARLVGLQKQYGKLLSPSVLKGLVDSLGLDEEALNELAKAMPEKSPMLQQLARIASLKKLESGDADVIKEFLADLSMDDLKQMQESLQPDRVALIQARDVFTHVSGRPMMTAEGMVRDDNGDGVLDITGDVTAADLLKGITSTPLRLDFDQGKAQAYTLGVTPLAQIPMDRVAGLEGAEHDLRDTEALRQLGQAFTDDNGQVNKKAEDAFMQIVGEGYREVWGGPTLKDYLASGAYRDFLTGDGKTDALVRERLDEVAKGTGDLYSAVSTLGFLGVDEDRGEPLRPEDNKGLIRTTWNLNGRPILVKDAQDGLRLADGVRGEIEYGENGLPRAVVVEDGQQPYKIVLGTGSGRAEIEWGHVEPVNGDVSERVPGGERGWQPFTTERTYAENRLGYQADTEVDKGPRYVKIDLNDKGIAGGNGWVEIGANGQLFVVMDANGNDTLDAFDFDTSRPIAIVPTAAGDGTRPVGEEGTLASYAAREMHERNRASDQPIVATLATGQLLDVDAAMDPDKGVALPDLFKSNDGDYQAIRWFKAEAVVDPRTVQAVSSGGLEGFATAFNAGLGEQNYLDPSQAGKPRVGTLKDDRVTFEEARAAGRSPAAFAETSVWIRTDPAAVPANATPIFSPSGQENPGNPPSREGTRAPSLGNLQPLGTGTTTPAQCQGNPALCQ